MRATSRCLITLAVLMCVTPAEGQTIHINRGNRTIQVSATETVRVPAEFALVDVGYSNRGPERGRVYEENALRSNRILKALAEAGVPKDAIETHNLELESSRDSLWGSEKNRPIEYLARQTWTIRSPANEAERIVDVAVAAGANHVGNVEWFVAEPQVLESQAEQAALVKARSAAERIAQQLGLKLGVPLHVSNLNPEMAPFRRHVVGRMAFKIAAAGLAAPLLDLYPKKVEFTVHVVVVFALESP